MSRILGLDLGTNSLGWAITEQREDSYTLVDRGVDIFQEGVAREKGEERPMVQTRTDARSIRRHYFRRRLRKIELLKVLVANSFCPYLSEESLDNWRYKKQYPLDDAFMGWLRSGDCSGEDNPYYDRYKALTEQLNLSFEEDRYLLGRALYHLAQRRGFLSNRKDQGNSDDGVVKGAIKQLDEDMDAAGCQYLGEFYYKLFRAGEKIRTGDGYGYAGRISHYEKEFNAICDKQNLSDELRKALHRAIFFQRPLKSQKGVVGHCTMEKGKSRCPISHPRFEEFRMLAFINNIKIKTPSDDKLRKLTTEEIEKIEPLFYRKAVIKAPHFDFEDIAKKLSGGKKGSYSYITDRVDAPYKFNFKMSVSVSGCPMTAALRGIFGDEWLSTACSLYAKANGKGESEILNDIWHVLFSFDDDDALRVWAKENLQMDDEQAEMFADIRPKQGYAALSLNAINKILPYMRSGYRYDEAVFMANLPSVVPSEQWNDVKKQEEIIANICSVLDNFDSDPQYRHMTKKQAIDEMLLEMYDIPYHQSERLYEPSSIETYATAQPNSEGLILLGSPRTSAVRNPMAMRALFRLRALVNQLLKEGKIDKSTNINIELSREMNSANERNAIERLQRENEKKHKEYAEEIKALFRAECGCDITPTATDILKFQLWKEQNRMCLYTGEEIGICEFLGANPKYDIEHTVPRSRGGDNSQMNKTLCDSDFNRRKKREKLPSELSNHAEIVARIEQLGWDKEIAKLEKQIFGCNRSAKNAANKEAKDKTIRERHYLRMRLSYLKGKLKRFMQQTAESDGFTNRQGVDIGIISKYATLYLGTVFDKKNIMVVKGRTTSDFRKMWGIQKEYTKKERVNHVHHCIDAVTIACINEKAYSKWADFTKEYEYYIWDKKPRPIISKPWPTFTEDVKAIADDLIVAHYTANNLPKHTRKRLRVRGKVQYNAEGKPIYVQGDTARASLHKDTFYGVIEMNDEKRFVVRKEIGKESFKESDIENIVDPVVKQKVQLAKKKYGFRKIQDILNYPIWMNEEKRIQIKKVRVYIPKTLSPIPIGNKSQRDLSIHEYKRPYYAVSDGNYCMAIYEGCDSRGRIKRSYKIVNNMEAVKFYNGKTHRYDLVPQSDDNDLPLKGILRAGTMVLFYEKSAEELYECTKSELSKRLYKVIKLNKDGRVGFKFHQEAQNDENLKLNYENLYGVKAPKALTDGFSKINFVAPYPKLLISLSNMNMYVEGYDFELTVTGEIKFKH